MVDRLLRGGGGGRMAGEGAEGSWVIIGVGGGACVGGLRGGRERMVRWRKGVRGGGCAGEGVVEGIGGWRRAEAVESWKESEGRGRWVSWREVCGGVGRERRVPVDSWMRVRRRREKEELGIGVTCAGTHEVGRGEKVHGGSGMKVGGEVPVDRQSLVGPNPLVLQEPVRSMRVTVGCARFCVRTR